MTALFSIIDCKCHLHLLIAEDAITPADFSNLIITRCFQTTCNSTIHPRIYVYICNVGITLIFPSRIQISMLELTNVEQKDFLTGLNQQTHSWDA